MKTNAYKRNLLSLAMLLAPFVICLTVFIDLMVNIGHYDHLAQVGISIWPYFSITLLLSIGGFISSAGILIYVIALQKSIKHIRRVIATSHICFILELMYIIQYVYMLGEHATPISIAALVLGLIGIVGFFVALALPKGPNFIAYFISSLLYIIFMILMTVICQARDNGMHIILLVFCSIAIGLASYGIYYFYLRKAARN